MRLPSFQLGSETETAMRKLKQATQRQKARRALKEKKEQAETSHDRPKSMKAGTRTGQTSTGRPAGGRNGHSQKATLH